MQHYPDQFVRVQTDLLGTQATLWLERIPEILATYARRWDLTVGATVEPLTYNYLAHAIRADGTPTILKICSPGGEFALQTEALHLFDGQGAVRLLASEAGDEVMLLECAEPGTMLSTLDDDDQATTIAISVMRRLWRPVPAVHRFPSVSDWGRGFQRMRERFGGGSGPFPGALTDRAEALFGELAASMDTPVLLHGDFHHDNALAAQREPWLVIDPKGVVGEPAYETATFMLNNLSELLTGAETQQVLRRRIAQLSEGLGIDRQRIHGWALSFALLSAWWSVEDLGRDWEGKIALAEHLTSL
jgi:streptomycin 6-kinase